MQFIQEIIFSHSKVQLINSKLVRVEIYGNTPVGKKEAKEMNDAIGILSKGKEVLVLMMADEMTQQREFGRAELQIAELREVRRGPARQLRLHAGAQFARAEGLGDVIVGAALQREHQVLLLAARGQHDDRQRARGAGDAQAAQQFDAGLAGQAPVDQHDIRRGLRQRQQGRLGAARAEQLIPGQRGGDQLLDRRLVFDQHYFDAHVVTPSPYRFIDRVSPRRGLLEHNIMTKA